MKKGTRLWPGNPQPRVRRLKTVGGIALMATLVGCGLTEPEQPAFVVRGTVWVEPGSTPSVVAQPLEGVSVGLSVRLGSVKLGTPISSETLATAISDAEGRFELQIQPNKYCNRDPLPPATIYLWVSNKEGYYLGAFGDSFFTRRPGILNYPQYQRCSGLVGNVVVRMWPESDLTFVSQPSASQEECLARPPGTICYGFNDPYVWLITTSSPCGRRSGGVYRGQTVSVAVCDQFEYHHVLGTDLIAQVLLNP